MVLVLSKNTDSVTNLVIAYLSKADSVIRLPNSNSNLKPIFNDIKYCIAKSRSIWLRNGDFKIADIENDLLITERRILLDFLHFLAETHTVCLGSLKKEFNHNKLIDLEIAQSCGIKIPKTWLITTHNELTGIFMDNQKKYVITKAVWNQKKFDVNGMSFMGGFPTVLTPENLKNIKSETFFPSLVQEYIEKEFEIRIFYLDGDFYAMAIFSQKDERTKIDFRNYNREKPNRNVPFSLPIDVQGKLTRFMKAINLNTGSIDMIYSTNNEFVFLEVNPVGQFGWLSENCNYYIERHIADYLTK